MGRVEQVGGTTLARDEHVAAHEHRRHRAQVEVIVGGTTFTVSASGVAIVGKLTCQDIVSIGSITATGAITPDV